MWWMPENVRWCYDRKPEDTETAFAGFPPVQSHLPGFKKVLSGRYAARISERTDRDVTICSTEFSKSHAQASAQEAL